jgi:hemerythrin
MSKSKIAGDDMPKIEWSSNFSLGIQPLDEHHRHLFELINKAHASFNEGVVADNFGIVIDALSKYAVYHFETEEQMMADTSYPGLSEHKEEHDSFAAWVADIQKEFYNGNKDFPRILINFLDNWVTDHIQQSDFRFGHFISSSINTKK